MKVLILSDGIPGHFNQSIGIAKILSEDLEITYKIINSQFKLKVFRSISMQIQKFFSRNFNFKSAKKIINLFHPIDLNTFDLIISTGRKVAYHSAALSMLHNIKNIHTGNIKNIDMKYFSAHITSMPVEKSPNNIVTVIPPTKFKPIPFSEKEKNKTVLFLLGGNGAGYVFKKNDWENLIKNIKDMIRNHNITPILVTSRRTNKKHEDFLFQELKNIVHKDSIWFHRAKKELDLEKLFKTSHHIFVTEESITMTAEAISSGLPVNTLFPVHSCPDNFFLKHLSEYENNGFINRLDLKDSFKGFKYDPSISIKIDQIRHDLKAKILEKINL